LALAFSRHALEFLIWMTAYRPGDAKPPLELPEAELTPADRLLLFLAYDALRDTEAAAPLRNRTMFARLGLLRLAFPDDFAGYPDEPAPDFAPWMTGLGAVMLEALAPWLTARWVQLERRKAQVGDWAALRELGLAQERMLAVFTDAAEAAFAGGLQGTGPARLADRIEVQRRALAVPRHLDRLQRWERRSRSVGYLDEGYAASQLWKADWERLGGDELAARAAALVRQVEPLAVQ
jgi:hypothetical protein